MAGINKVILVGCTGKDVELRYTPNGSVIGSVSLAVTEKGTDKNGAKTEKTEWFNLVMFGKTAEMVSKYVAKGSLIYVEGKIVTKSWDKDGVKQYRTEILVAKIQFLNLKEKAGQGTQSAGTPQKPPQPNYDDEYPF